MSLFGGVEGGGTKFRCAIGTGPEDIRSEIQFSTRSPAQTLAEAASFFAQSEGDLTAIGVASFGPIDLDPSSKTYGYITTTPKDGWSQTNIVGHLTDALGVPVGFDTDVGAAALGERKWGAAQEVDNFVYLTVGTGIGGAVVSHAELLHGLLHPEIGHMLVPRATDDNFAGVCPFHGDCLEGLASGVAIQQRCGKQWRELAQDDPAWALEAHYLAAGLSNIILTVSPQRIILGGGVMDQTQLFPLIRSRVQELLNGYIAVPEVGERIESYIVPAQLGARSGVLGGIVLAMQAAEKLNP